MGNERGVDFVYQNLNSNSKGYFYYNYPANTVKLSNEATGSRNDFILDANGNIGIGTATMATGYKLSVYGKIICEELRVEIKASWPDYVFGNDYKLPDAFCKQQVGNIPSQRHDIIFNSIIPFP